LKVRNQNNSRWSWFKGLCGSESTFIHLNNNKNKNELTKTFVRDNHETIWQIIKPVHHSEHKIILTISQIMSLV